MSLSLSASRKLLTGSLFLAAALSISSHAADYITNGAEYAIAGALRTDQVRPRLAIGNNGGYIVWQDTLSDTEGLGVSAMQLDSGLSGKLSPIRVNQTSVGDQERPQLGLLKGGGAVFVWQGGPVGAQHIFARFLSPGGTWLGGDIPVSDYSNSQQSYPAVSVLQNGNVIVVWSSSNQRGPASMQDVYAQLLSPTGEKIGSEFSVNQFQNYNQRTPVVAALADGGFIVAWVSEQQRTQGADNPDPNFVYGAYQRPSIDIFARRFDASAQAVGAEFLVNTSSAVCANPAIAGRLNGGFTVTWGERDQQNASNSWDVYARAFSSAGVGGQVSTINQKLYGDQFDPKISSAGEGAMVVWNSLAQDGSFEGVYARVLDAAGAPVSAEFQVNTTTVSKQIHPAVASDDSGRVLVAWTSFLGGNRSYDLFAQRYVSTEQAVPSVDAIFAHVPFSLRTGAYEPVIQISWAMQEGFPGSYEVYANGSSEPVASITTNVWQMTSAHGLKPSTTVSFRVAFVTSDGRRSQLSPSASATTWSGFNWSGVPFEWMTANYGNDIATWPQASSRLQNDGPTLGEVFVTGGRPLDPSSWLRAAMNGSENGFVLTWNPQPGLLYQVQHSADTANWTNLGRPRLATGREDELNVGLSNSGYYRVMLLR